jgi:hypothetical protein
MTVLKILADGFHGLESLEPEVSKIVSKRDYI